MTRLFDIISLWVNIQVLLLTKNASKILYSNYFKVQSALFNRIVVTFVHDARRHFLVDFKIEIDNVVIIHSFVRPPHYPKTEKENKNYKIKTMK